MASLATFSRADFDGRPVVKFNGETVEISITATGHPNALIWLSLAEASQLAKDIQATCLKVVTAEPIWVMKYSLGDGPVTTLNYELDEAKAKQAFENTKRMNHVNWSTLVGPGFSDTFGTP